VAEDDELLALIHESGGVSLLIGFESVSEESLRSVGKWKLRLLRSYPAAIENIQSHGIVVDAAFVVGFDSDGPGVFDDLRRFLLENNLFLFNISVLTPFPGTRLRARLEREGRLLDTGWDNHHFLGVNFVPKQIPPAELQRRVLTAFGDLWHDAEFHRRKLSHFRRIYRELYRAQMTAQR